jgi:hypothetical protein
MVVPPLETNRIQPVGAPFEGVAPRRPVSLTARLDTPRAIVDPDDARTVTGADSAPQDDGFGGVLPRSRDLPLEMPRPRVPPDGRTTLYNPRGAPSDAVPALARLDARVSYEPLYLHHFATTRYAFVSAMPVSVSDRRRSFEIYA